MYIGKPPVPVSIALTRASCVGTLAFAVLTVEQHRSLHLRWFQKHHHPAAFQLFQAVI